MKKLHTFLLLIIIICSATLFGCTNNVSQVRKTSFPNNSVGNLSIYAHDKVSDDSLFLLFNLGHSFLTFENTSNQIINIGNYKVSPNETICFGTWSISSHFGVWYNLEYNYSAIHNRYDGRVSITKGVTANNIEEINKFIYSHNTWSPIKNCSYFALNLWNKVANENEMLKTYWIYSPAKVANQLREFEDFETNKSFITKTNFGYFSNTEYVSFTMEGDYTYV